MDSRDSKRKLLKQVRGIHGNPERVRSTLFQSHPFFDGEDKAQVKYEMLRRREVERSGLMEVSAGRYGGSVRAKAGSQRAVESYR